MTDLETLVRDYWKAVERLRRMAVPDRERLLVLVDIETIYRPERTALERLGRARRAAVPTQS